jgi:restriction system protein
MAVPDFQTLMLPVLRAYADGQIHASMDVRAAVGAGLQITAEDQAEMLPSARQSRFANRVAWAHSYLKQARLIESPGRGQYQLTPRGREVLGGNHQRIDIAFLDQYPEFQTFRSRSELPALRNADPALMDILTKGLSAAVDGAALTPDEQVRIGAARLRESLATQLLERVKQSSPQFFETLVVQLLVAMGYGGSEEDAAQVVGRSGDGGIDGIIKEDRLGLESIYIQAKRWTGGQTVGRPDIQQFAGALQGQRARKGVFITTSTFTRDAFDYVKTLQSSIVLIDGPHLAQLMVEFGVGVSEFEVIRLKRIDEDYFAEE